MNSSTPVTQPAPGKTSAVVKPLKVQPLKVTGDDLLKMIMLHIKPRHMYKLMQTSKKMYTTVYFHTHYWNRVAAHVLLRDHLPLADPSWYPMFFPKGGYNYAMEEFMKLVPSINTKGNPMFKPDSIYSMPKLLVRYATLPFFEYTLEKKDRFWGKVNSLSLDSSVKDILRAYPKIISDNCKDYWFRSSVKSFARFTEDGNNMSMTSQQDLMKLLIEHFESELVEIEGDDPVKYKRRIGIIKTYFGVTIDI